MSKEASLRGDGNILAVTGAADDCSVCFQTIAAAALKRSPPEATFICCEWPSTLETVIYR